MLNVFSNREQLHDLQHVLTYCTTYCTTCNTTCSTTGRGGSLKDVVRLPKAHAGSRSDGPDSWVLSAEQSFKEVVAMIVLLQVAALNAYIVGKAQGHAFITKRWPSFQNFLEALSSDLIGDTRADKNSCPSCPAAHSGAHLCEVLSVL